MTTAVLEIPEAKHVICDGEEVQLIIEEKLSAFDKAIEQHDFLEIDGDIEGDSPKNIR
ncbi:hypothetical protein [Candidatus Kuenenia stuttgartiensis]|uniref:hypothetical protein n=1 Tax=Kuenenia stuttgartiensis TaxID=174633 RepID=UPI00146DBB34|nr:hypothetical protein [Candidatus Kuenenia stuttgartiensis]